jgi:hypothetical protein
MFHIDYGAEASENYRFCGSVVTNSRVRIHLFLLLLVSSFSLPTWAGAILQMPIGDTGNVFFGNRGRNPVYGRGISLTDLMYGAGTVDLVESRLYFITGRGEGRSGNTLSYGPGGVFVVRGCVDTNGNPAKCGKGDIRGILMRGTFLDAKIVDEGGEIILVAQILDQLNPALAALLNLPDESVETLDLTMVASEGTRYWTGTNVTGGSLSILSEPSSIAIMGTSLAGLCLLLLATLRVGGQQALRP